MADNAQNLWLALEWLRALVAGSLMANRDKRENDPIAVLRLVPDDSAFARFIRTYEPTHEELAIVLMGLVPHLDPQFFESTVAEVLPGGVDPSILGGVRGQSHRGLIPTGETAIFVLCGTNLRQRMETQGLFGAEHWLVKRQVLWLDRVPEGEPMLSGRLILNPEVVEELVTGVVAPPAFSTAFPAQHLRTALDWDDLVLHPATREQVREIQDWITFSDRAMSDWGLERRVKPGYRALFYGPPGTGKTLTATLLGKHTGRNVFRIDLSRVVSKYIGETEQNLARLFDRAESKDWILFFDEADALFGRRTEVRDAHDKYANHQTAYLLQRIETFDGLVILATNQRNNIDEAFLRRFQSVVHFPMPRAEERLLLWTNSLPTQLPLDPDINLPDISSRYEVTGAAIMNIVQHCSIGVLARALPALDRDRLEAAIQREFLKEGKVL